MTMAAQTKNDNGGENYKISAANIYKETEVTFVFRNGTHMDGTTMKRLKLWATNVIVNKTTAVIIYGTTAVIIDGTTAVIVDGTTAVNVGETSKFIYIEECARRLRIGTLDHHRFECNEQNILETLLLFGTW